uniref:Uncharacterized protein n=1 Tax=viral metagenome TaxID=1070528 RepID=A0A6C0B0B5_9ZZZZ
MNKTRRYNKRGGQNTNYNNNNNNNNTTKKNNSSLFSTLGTAAINAVKQSASYAAEKGARFFGYQKMTDSQQQQEKQQEQQQQQEPTETEKRISELTGEAKQIASGIATKASQVGAVVVETLNKGIEDSGVKETVGQAIGNTVGIATDILKTADEKLNNPEFIKEVSEVANKFTNDASEVLKAADPAINKVIDQTSEIGAKMGTKVGEEGLNIALTTLGEVPGIGAVVAVARDLDSATKAAGAVIEAGADTIKTFANGIKETEDALKKKMSEAQSLQERTANNISAFHTVDKVLPIRQAAINSIIKRPNMKRGGGASKKFRKLRRKLSRKLHFRQPE